MLQTYFVGKGRIDYFVVVDNIMEKNLITLDSAIPLKEEEKDLFIKLENDYQDVKGDTEKQATIVQDFGDSRSARVLWLERTGFPSHLSEGDEKADVDLVRIIHAAESVLRDAYALCSDTSPDRKMTQQRANILNEFYAGASGRADGFRYYKNPSTLVKYFSTFKQLLVYFFRVVYYEDGHFTRTNPEQRLPGQVIRLTAEQKRALQEIVDALKNEDDALLKHAVRRFYLALICQTVGSVPFRSAVLSFCAMLSRKVRSKGCGLWEELGNFNSNLSALTWTAQLIIFDYACFNEQEDEDQIPAFLSTILAAVSVLSWESGHCKALGTVVLGRTDCGQAHTLLYEELMFKAKNLIPMQSWRLKDDLDMEDFGGSWLSHPGNAEFVEKADRALFQCIQESAELRAMFLTEADDGSMVLSVKAMAIYEATAQEFLKRLLVLKHIPPGPPLREPELLSVTWRNTARQRHLFLWEKLVMIYTHYHKGQQQSGVYKDNIRFLPKAIGDLLLDYIAYVIPLRQMFLRQQTPKALISPYVWAKLDGSVWPDGTLSRCLRKACARAKVPQFHTSNWRQISASICKEKFSAKDRANFDLEDNGVEDMEDELDLIAMAEQSNHTYRTFNQAYAGSSTLTMNALLHRNYRASETWRTFFRFDYVLQGKRPRGVSETLSLRMLDASKRSQVRRRGAYSGADLEAVACRLYNTLQMKLRVPGQRDGLLAMMGPHPAEQVLLVMGTGSGKSLLFMVGASVADARTTILVLPMVALRGDMLDRCRRVGIQPLIWSIERRDSASLVIMSAEAVCTESFLEYAHLLVNRQQLDRIVIDECHLTITANDYRKCMSQLGWYVRQVKTQTVWLTATLPPTMQDDFIEHNKLVRPRIIRESTNRPNIKYMISRHTGATTLVEVAAKLVQTYWPRKQIFNLARDKIIIYCLTKRLLVFWP
ncbi:hypothetical protein V500_02461 [Pseudogymnoascus sp. VKM F-4518 (FW-2643)]|nr:hypothetical protein V500_02461 [Pseudogymnoascus sp. VKM F-4518 (FW-2643)]